MKTTISHLSEEVRVVLSDRQSSLQADLQVFKEGKWGTASKRPFAKDIRVNPIPAMTRVANQLNLI